MRKTIYSLSMVALIGLTTTVSGLWSKPAEADEVFIGTIRYFGFNFAPRGWTFCDGQLLAVSQNDALFALLGTTYGGDGRTTFGLPDMRGRLPVHQGQGLGLSSYHMGQKGGVEQVTLTANQIGHTHNLRAHNSEGNQASPTGHTLAANSNDITYNDAAPSVAMNGDAITATGSATPDAHENRPPFLGVYCNIALVGVFPSRN